MSSSEWRDGSSLLRFLGAALLVTGGASLTGCGWVPGATTRSVHVPTSSVDPENANPSQAECERHCGQLVSDCHFGTLVVPASAPPDPARARATYPAVICEVTVPGHLSMWGSYGRRLDGAAEMDAEPRTASEHFFHAAHAEAVSIVAFRQLVLDLEAFSAPPALIHDARRAARDEAVHARLTLTLARAFGIRREMRWPALPRTQRRRPELFAVALENATGGCVNETFGAWLQLFQARNAAQRDVRAIARRIARDEADHAALAFRLFDWFDERLAPAERRLVREAMQVESARLGQGSRFPPDVARAIGLPDEDAVRRVAETITLRLPRECAERAN